MPGHGPPRRRSRDRTCGPESRGATTAPASHSEYAARLVSQPSLLCARRTTPLPPARLRTSSPSVVAGGSEEHTSELQSRSDIVCRLLLEKKKPGPGDLKE